MLAFVLLILFAGQTIWVMTRGKPKRWFTIWDPSVGVSGAFIPTKLEPGQRFAKWTSPDGVPYLFPILPGYGAPWGKKGRDTMYFGNLSNAVPFHLGTDDAEDGETHVQVFDGHGDLQRFLDGLEKTERPDQAADLMLGGAFNFTHTPAVYEPDAMICGLALEDVREIKANIAQREGIKDNGGLGADRGGLLRKVLPILGIALAFLAIVGFQQGWF